MFMVTTYGIEKQNPNIHAYRGFKLRFDQKKKIN